jgi:RsiW-degrading membrane proteinase PrsW (M82 family)
VTFLRLTAVIVLWFIALLFWNLSALRPRTLFSLAGLARLFIGAVFVLAALLLLYESFPDLRQTEMSYFAIGSFLAALVADFIIGEDVRALFKKR